MRERNEGVLGEPARENAISILVAADSLLAANNTCPVLSKISDAQSQISVYKTRTFVLKALRLPQVSLCGAVFDFTYSFYFARPLFRCDSWTCVSLPFHYFFLFFSFWSFF